MNYLPSTDGLNATLKKNFEDIARALREIQSAANAARGTKTSQAISAGITNLLHGAIQGRNAPNQHIIDSVTGLRDELGKVHMKYAGMRYPIPDWSLNGAAPNITMAAGKCYLYDNADNRGYIKDYDIPAKSFTLTLGADHIVVVNFSSGTPEYELSVGANPPYWNSSNIIGVTRFWWDGVTIHSRPIGAMGEGLPEKHAYRQALTKFYERAFDSGLILGESSSPVSLTATLTAGVMFAGADYVPLYAFDSSSNLFTKYVKITDVWYPSNVTTYDNANYNDNAGLVVATAGKYLVNWVWRSVGDVVQCFLILGTTQYNTLADAQASSPRTDVPPVVSKHGVLMGRQIVKVGATSGKAESVYTTAFSFGGVTNHNDLSGIQYASPAVSGEAYHLSADQADHASKLAANWDMYLGSQQPAMDDTVDIGYDGATPKRVRNVFAMVVKAATGLYRAGLELASVFAPISHASNSTTYGIADASNYGHVKSSTTNPLMDGVADPGTAGALVANYNHRHPTDTSREAAWGRASVTASSDMNTFTVPGTYAVNNAAAATYFPSGAYGWGVLQVLPFSTGSLVQMYMPHRTASSSDSGIWLRVSYTGTWQDWQHIYGDAYNATKYAPKADPIFTGLLSALNGYFSGYLSVGANLAVNGFTDIREEFRLSGLHVGTANADATVLATASGFVNTATYTANRYVDLPAPVKGRILTLSNLGSSTAYGMLIRPYSGTTIHYGVTPTLTGGNASGIKSLILEGVSDTKWAIMSQWIL